MLGASADTACDEAFIDCVSEHCDPHLDSSMCVVLGRRISRLVDRPSCQTSLIKMMGSSIYKEVSRFRFA